MAYRPISINPQQAVAQLQQAKQLGMQDAARSDQLQRQMRQGAVGDIKQIQDFLSRKEILDQVAQLGGPQAPMQAQAPTPAPVRTPEQDEQALEMGGLVDDQTRSEFVKDTQELINADPLEMVEKLAQRKAKLDSQGRDSSDTDVLMRLASTNPQQAKLAIGNINSMIQNKAVRDYMARSPAEAMSFLQGLAPKGGVSDVEKARAKEDADVRKELRGDLRSRMKELDTSINVLETNYKKINNLSGEVEKGNRSAIAQTLVAMVKLNDPNSAVLNSEMEAAINTQNPVAAVAQYLQGKNVGGDVINSITANFDPLSPEVIKVDQIKATADAMLSANVDSMVSSYQESKALGENLGASGIKSIFTKSRDNRLDKLSKIGRSGSGSAKPEKSEEPEERQAASGYSIGQRSKGFEYIGGDPKDKNSWRKL